MKSIYQMLKAASPESKHTIPENVLALAVLERTLADICTPGIDPYEKRAAEAWLFSGDEHTFSAVWWADATGSEHILSQIQSAALKGLYRRGNGVFNKASGGRN